MKYQVIKAFKDFDDTTKKIGDIMDLDYKRASKLLQYKLIGLAKEETKEETKEEFKHIGGGYYEFADGTRIKGKENAMGKSVK